MRSEERVDERIGEGVPRCFGHIDRVEKDRVAKRVYEGEFAGSRSVGRDELIPSKSIKKEKIFGSQASKENGA